MLLCGGALTKTAATTLNSLLLNKMSWDSLIPHDKELNGIHIIYFALGLFIVTFGYLSLLIKDKLNLSEAFVACFFGVVIGPVCLNLFDASATFVDANLVTLEFARLVLGIQCLAAGIQSPGDYVWKQRVSLGMLLGPVMLSMWLVSTLILYSVLGLSALEAFVIGACITPTDPVLSNSIVKGAFADMHVSVPLRLLLSAESAANDGLGWPFLLLPLYISRYASLGEGLGWWLLRSIIYQIGLSIVLGIVIGLASRELLKLVQRYKWSDQETILGFSISLSIFVVGLFSRLGIDEILGCFVVGLLISWDEWFNKQIEESHIQEILDSLLNITFFIFLGTRIPWSSLLNLPGIAAWRLFVGSILIILFRRLPAVLLLQNYIPALESFQEAFFCGWFGPIGAGAIFYASLCIQDLDIPEEPLFSVVSIVVLASLLLHGGSVGLFHVGLMHRDRTRTRTRTESPQRRPVLPDIEVVDMPSIEMEGDQIVDEKSDPVRIVSSSKSLLNTAEIITI